MATMASNQNVQTNDMDVKQKVFHKTSHCFRNLISLTFTADPPTSFITFSPGFVTQRRKHFVCFMLLQCFTMEYNVTYSYVSHTVTSILPQIIHQSKMTINSIHRTSAQDLWISTPAFHQKADELTARYVVLLISNLQTTGLGPAGGDSVYEHMERCCWRN